jgi:Fic family protein
MGRARGHFVIKRYTGIAGAQTAAERRGSRYRAFIPDPIAGMQFSLPSALAADLEKASTAVRALNGSPPKLVSLEAVARHLLRQESTASSRIEGLSLGHRRIALADFDPESSSDQKATDIVGNIRAMVQALDLGDTADAITPEHIKGIHRTLLRFGEDEPIAGILREGPGWIGGSAPTTAVYVPPPHEELQRLLDDLCAFMNRTDVPALMQAAAVHAQFENIHPFADGNGRVGRCLIHTALRRRGLAPSFVPPISVVLSARRDPYFFGLAEYRNGELEHWLSFFADVTAVAAEKAEELASRIDSLEEHWLAQFKRRPRRDSTVYKVLRMLPAHPVLSVPTVEQQLGVSDVAAGGALNELARIAVIRPIDDRLRGRVWECPAMYSLMAEFEQELA